MKPLKLLTPFLLFAFIVSSISASAQNRQANTLFTAGHASAFIGGLYDAYLPYSELKKHGDFGLGAPDKLDGELLILEGKIYQTTADGKTVEIPDTGKTPFSVVNFFKADMWSKSSALMDKSKLYAFLDSLLPKQNDIYAIRIRGEFGLIKTRAFPPVTQKPYTPLADLLSLQRFFEFKDIQGDLVGYRIPAHMEGSNISGYHFHFLSANKQSGGHLIDLLTKNIAIEIDYLNAFTVDLPPTTEFRNFDLSKDRSEEVRKVENGKNNER